MADQPDRRTETIAQKDLAAALRTERSDTRDYRRESDRIVNSLVTDVGHLHDCVESLKGEMRRNTEVTEQVRDILASFRVMAMVAKWAGTIAAAVASGIAVVKAWR